MKPIEARRSKNKLLTTLSRVLASGVPIPLSGIYISIQVFLWSYLSYTFRNTYYSILVKRRLPCQLPTQSIKFIYLFVNPPFTLPYIWTNQVICFNELSNNFFSKFYCFSSIRYGRFPKPTTILNGIPPPLKK